MVGFYALAIGVAGALLYIPYAEWHYAGRLHANIAIPCVAGAGAIIWSIIPRWDRFAAPGPQLDSHTQPKLFQVIDRIAALTGQHMPAEVYLLSDVNAWVADRGGVVRPGQAVRLEHDGAVLHPFDMVSALASGTMSAEAWRQLCTEAGIADCKLRACRESASA
jgi:hypothetical protein